MSDRPSFRDEASFRQLYDQRLPFYELSDYRVETNIEPLRVVEQISGHRDFRPGASVNLRTSRVASPAIFFALAIALAAISLGPCMPGLLARAVAAQPFAATSPSVLIADKGKLRILISGQVAGREDFEIAPSGGEWIARGSTDAKPAQGPSTRIMGALRLTPAGTPISYEWSTQGEKKLPPISPSRT